MHFVLKNIHLLAVALSAILLSIRYALLMAESAKIEHELFQRVPPVVDAVMLLSGIGLIFVTGLVPFSAEATWFTEKITCLLAYFALGFFTIRMAKGKLIRTFAYFGTIGWLFAAGKVTLTKIPTIMG